MARIIKRVELVEQTAFWACRCKSEIEFSKQDICFDDRDGNYVICPVCRTWIASKLLRWER